MQSSKLTPVGDRIQGALVYQRQPEVTLGTGQHVRHRGRLKDRSDTAGHGYQQKQVVEPSITGGRNRGFKVSGAWV